MMGPLAKIVVLVAVVALVVAIANRPESKKKTDSAKMVSGYLQAGPQPMLKMAPANRDAYVQNPFGEGPPARGYADVTSTYSGEWEASAESPYESRPGVLRSRLDRLQAMSAATSGKSALDPPVRLQGKSGGVAYVDGVDIQMPVLRSESLADTGFHGKTFDESTSLLVGVV